MSRRLGSVPKEKSLHSVIKLYKTDTAPVTGHHLIWDRRVIARDVHRRLAKNGPFNVFQMICLARAERPSETPAVTFIPIFYELYNNSVSTFTRRDFYGLIKERVHVEGQSFEIIRHFNSCISKRGGWSLPPSPIPRARSVAPPAP